MKVLLTGQTGFIGSNIYNYLCNLGYEVVYLTHEEFENQEFRKLYFDKPDIVIHCAWPRLPNIHDMRHMEFAQATMNFFNYCRDAGLRVLNLGSHNEYKLSSEPLTETSLCEPIDTYGIAKLAVTLYAKKLGYNTLRLAAVYGEGGRTFKDIVEKEGAKYAMPENVKDFVPVERVCHAVERMIHAQHLFGEIINVSSGKQESAEELAKEVEGAEARWHKYPQRQYEPSYWVLDNMKMQYLLNLKP